MRPEVGDEVEQRLARLEQTEQRLARTLELLELQAARPRRNWDVYAAVIASLIGALALAVSAYTARVQRQQLRAQVWPRLELGFSGVELTFFAINAGTGPARVTAMRVIVDGAPVKNWTDVQNKTGFSGDERLRRSGFSHRVLPADKQFIIIKPDDNEPSRSKFRELLPGHAHAISIAACYCSVLDECWTVGLDKDGSADTASAPQDCPIPASERFEE